MAKRTEIFEDTPVMQEEIQQEVLFEGGPSLEWVNEWKSQYGDIYLTEVDDESYIWRPISRSEYKDILKAKNADALHREELMAKKCVLWPEGYGHTLMSLGRAGVPSLLAEQIMDKSGFVPTKDSTKL